MGNQIPEPLKVLVQRVSRTFYPIKEIMVLDVLCRRRIIKDEDLATYSKMNLKEVHKVCAKLKEDRLIRVETRSEVRRADGRAIPKIYYVLDYKLFVDVTKWKMFKLRQAIEDRMKTELENRGYVCPNCGKLYSALEAQTLTDFNTYLFVCEVCNHNLEQNDNEVGVKGSQECLARFMEQTKGIVDLLKVTDDIALPSYTPQSLQSEFVPPAGDGTITPSSDTGSLVKGEAGSQKDAIVVVFEEDESAAEKAKRKRSEEAARLSTHTLPMWHRVSTVSGEAHTVVNDNKDKAAEDHADGPNSAKDGDDHAEYLESYYETMLTQSRNQSPSQSDGQVSDAQMQPMETKVHESVLDDDDDDEDVEFEEVEA